MPIGCVSLVAPIITDLGPKKPKKILDAGMGMGFWGAALRQWLDMGYTAKRKKMADGTDGTGPLSSIQSWPTYLMGIEGFAKYRNHAWGLYDHVHVCSIQEYLATFKTDRFDAILLLDVLEHFTEMDGIGILFELMGRLEPGGTLYVGTPGVWIEQGEAYGNEFERHRSLWKADDLREGRFEIMSLSVIGSGAWDGATYDFEGTERDPWGNQMLLAKWEATPARIAWRAEQLGGRDPATAPQLGEECFYCGAHAQRTFEGRNYCATAPACASRPPARISNRS